MKRKLVVAILAVFVLAATVSIAFAAPDNGRDYFNWMFNSHRQWVKKAVESRQISTDFILMGFPGYSLAQGEHSGHGPAPADNVQGSRQTTNLPDPGSPAPADRPVRSGGGNTGQAASQPGHGGHESGGKASGGSSHGGDAGSHQGSGASDLDPVRDTLVGGFAGLNALVIAVAAILKKKALKGGAE